MHGKVFRIFRYRPSRSESRHDVEAIALAFGLAALERHHYDVYQR